MTSFTSLLQTGFPFVADLFSNFVLGYDGGLEGRKSFVLTVDSSGSKCARRHRRLESTNIAQGGLALLIQAHDDGNGRPLRECK